MSVAELSERVSLTITEVEYLQVLACSPHTTQLLQGLGSKMQPMANDSLQMPLVFLESSQNSQCPEKRAQLLCIMDHQSH